MEELHNVTIKGHSCIAAHIKCTNSTTTAINIANTNAVLMKGLSVSDCGTGVKVANVSTLSLNNISVQNCHCVGVIVLNTSTVIILDSLFTHNEGDDSGNVKLTGSKGNNIYHISSSTFSYGTVNTKNNPSSGGLSIIGLQDTNHSVIIFDCLLIGNSGGQVGGLVIYTVTSIDIQDSIFINNSVIMSRGLIGGIFLYQFTTFARIRNCDCSHNRGVPVALGGAFIQPLDSPGCSSKFYNNSFVMQHEKDYMQYKANCFRQRTIEVVNCTFSYNQGSALSFKGMNIFLLMRNVLVSSNYGLSKGIIMGAISLYSGSIGDNNIAVFTNVTVANHTSTGMQVYRYRVIFASVPSTFCNNRSPGNGGAISASDLSSFSSVNNTIVYFINNTARSNGGGIFISSAIFSLDGDAFCSLSDLAANFSGNKAMYSTDCICGGYYYSCLYDDGRKTSSLQDRNFSNVVSFPCNNFKIFENIPQPFNQHVSSVPLGVCLCDSNGLPDCSNRLLSRSIHPGESITLSLVAVGMCKGINSGTIQAVYNKEDMDVTGDVYQDAGNSCQNYTYQFKQKTLSVQKSVLKIGVLERTSFHLNLKPLLTIGVTFLPCPNFFSIEFTLESETCECRTMFRMIPWIQCNVSWVPHPIQRNGNNWLYHSLQHNCIVIHENCPFDYCDTSLVFLNLNKSELQCMYNRSGILCGACQTGLSLTLGSNQCETCENKYLTLLSAFIIAGIGLVVLLLISSFTVSVGSTNGLLFYANIVKLNEAVLFPNGVRLPVLTQFISWLNLDLGIQTCFFNGLNGYWKTWLQFVFPLYIWWLIVAIIISCRYSIRLSRFCGNNAVPVLATLLLMSYSKLLRTITNGLIMSTIKCEGTVWNVWSVDGNITYLKGKHIPLFVVSLLFLLIGLVYTGLVFSSQWLQRFSDKCCKSSIDPVVKLKPLIDAYSGPYKDKYRFWTGLLLIIRLLLTTLFSYTTSAIPQINNYVIVIVCVILLQMSQRDIYRVKELNGLESFYIINLGMLCLLNTLSVHLQKLSLRYYITVVSVALSLAGFIVTVILHVYMLIKKKYGGSKNERRTLVNNDESEPLLQESYNELSSPVRVVHRRESLIFDFQATY